MTDHQTHIVKNEQGQWAAVCTCAEWSGSPVDLPPAAIAEGRAHEEAQAVFPPEPVAP